MAFSQTISESPPEALSESLGWTALSATSPCEHVLWPHPVSHTSWKWWRCDPPVTSLSKGRRLCEVWAGGVCYISLCHGMSFPDKHKNVWRNLECNWNIERKLTSTEELAEGLRGIKSSGKLPVVNKFYIIQTDLLLFFFLIT